MCKHMHPPTWPGRPAAVRGTLPYAAYMLLLMTRMTLVVVPAGKNVKIMNKEGISEATYADRGIFIRSGIVVLDKGTAVPDGTVI